LDIRLVQNTEFPKYSVTVDWFLRDDGTLDDTQSLATAVIVALGTDRLAEENDILPDFTGERRGWWGDLQAEEIWQGWPIGTRLWLLSRAKITGPGASEGATVARVEQYIREALQPFVDLRVASSFDVHVNRIGKERIDALIRMYRGPKVAVDLRFQILWAGIIESGGSYDIGTPITP
jgi:phage gp46-like protein